MKDNNYGFLRVAAVCVEAGVGDTPSNAKKTIDAAMEAAENGADLIVTPELSLTGCTCGDLFFQNALLQNAAAELEEIASKTARLKSVLAVGLPIKKDGAIYDAAAVLFKGEILAVIPKTFLWSMGGVSGASGVGGALGGVSSARHFASAKNLRDGETVFVSKNAPAAPFGSRIMICGKNFPELKIAFEIGDDFFAPFPPSASHALAGALVIANPCASPETIGKAEMRQEFVKNLSTRLAAAYIQAGAGGGESSQDTVFAGHNIIAENGETLAESSLFDEMAISSDTKTDTKAANAFSKTRITYSDIDLNLLETERAKRKDFFSRELGSIETISASAASAPVHYKKIFIDLEKRNYDNEKLLYRTNEKNAFVPKEKSARQSLCSQAIFLQAQALAKRLQHIGAKKAVVGLSGGLDSTLSLLAACRSFDICSLDRSGIIAITMPGLGTTDRTYNNALALAKETGASLREIPIADSLRQHFKDIGHDGKTRDAAYENAQARERTQILMDIANMENALVIGTGDLSEAALGWCTFNGDHISMYNVNASIPKTLVRRIVRNEADFCENENLRKILLDILNTPVSPELLPPDNGSISQKTEDIVGPYELHDFFLHKVLRFGFSPSKIYFLAKRAFAGEYKPETIKSWLKVFYTRFFSQQFKRSCSSDGADVSGLSLSPRGAYMMPSDASANIWLAEIERL